MGSKKTMDADTYLYYAMEIGEKMLTSGAEVGRVEDTIRRICKAYGAKRVDVLTITSSIVTTVYGEDSALSTQTKRVEGSKNNLYMLEELNRLSRKLCEERLGEEAIKEELGKIENGPLYPFGVQIILYAMISGSFCLFFGGSVRDMAASAVIGICLKFVDRFLQKGTSNPLIIAFLCAAAGGLLSNLAVVTGIGENADLISIGNIMLLIPGLAFTNAIRDIFSRDMITGVIRFVESVVLAVTIALGFTFTGFLF